MSPSSRLIYWNYLFSSCRLVVAKVINNLHCGIDEMISAIANKIRIVILDK